MGLLSNLFSRHRLKQVNRDAYFSIATAADSFGAYSDLGPTGKAGLVFNPVESTFFENLNSEVNELLKVSSKTTDSQYEIIDDTYGTRWVVLTDHDFDDLVSILHLVGETITEHGFGDRLVAAVFGFTYKQNQAYLIYNIKRGQFYPIVLSGEKERDNRSEMKIGTLMEKEKLPVEKNLEQWYALWGIPF
ncbi:MAG: hypothetical protein QGF12_05755 [SAR202 cluster bacterium]|nr:hypothetical protein [SAR202 cluster bacterium]